MLKLIEQSPSRTVFEERRAGLRAVALICLGLTAAALLALWFQWRSAAAAYPERLAEPRVVLAAVVFAAILLTVGAGSVYALLLSRRMTLTLDRDAGEIVLIAPRGFKMAIERFPYYGVKTVRLTGGEKALALVFVLRDGRVIPVTAAPAHDRSRLEALAQTIRDSLGI